MIDPIVVAVVLSARERRLAKGENSRNVVSAMLEKQQLDELVDEASALRAIAASVEQESTPAAVKARAQARQQAETERIARGETTMHNGTPMLTKGAYIDTLERKIEIKNAADELERLRKRAGNAHAAAENAKQALRVGSGQGEARKRLEDDVRMREDFARAADADVERVEEKLSKLQRA